MTLTECEIEKNGEELSNCYMDNSLRDTSGMFQADIYVNNNFVIQSKCNINRKENDKFYIYDLPSKDYYAKYSKNIS